MFASAPTAAAGNVQTVLDKVAAFVATAKSASAGGITWAEFGELLLALIRLLVESLDVLGGIPGNEKKAFVLDAVGMLFDAVADKAVPLVLWPVWLLCRPAIRALVISIASGAIEEVLPLVRGAE